MNLWTASVTRRDKWNFLDISGIFLSVIAGLYFSSYWTGVPFNIKFTFLKLAVIFSVLVCSLIATSAIYLKAFRRWRVYRRDFFAISRGVILATIITSILFVTFGTHDKPLSIILSDSLYPSLFAFITFAIIRRIENRVQRYRYKDTTAVFIEVGEEWYSSIREVRQVLNNDWSLAVVNLSEDKIIGDIGDGIEVWNAAKLEKWMQNLGEQGRKNLFVFGHHQPRTELHRKIIEHAYGNIVPITNIIDFHEEILEKVPLIENEDSWYSSAGLPKPGIIHLFLKRVMDILVGLPLFLIGLPIVGILGIIIRRESPGPIIFKQKRVGQGGKNFTCYKLRTMTVHDDDSDIWPNFEASKVTKSGEFMRRTGLDELPQLFNVIKGNMSFIGPRPARPKVTQRHIDRLPYYAVVKSVKPGISGWAQLHQGQDAGDETMFEKTRYNLYYAKHFSIWLEILIYVRTFSQLINGKKQDSVYMKIHLPPTEDKEPIEDGAKTRTTKQKSKKNLEKI